VLSGQITGTATGMPLGPLITTTCLCSALGCLLMGIWANYPVGLAPGMGANFLFVLTLLPAVAGILGLPAGDSRIWQTALGVVFVSGVFFWLITLANLRQILMSAISTNLKLGIAAGIGLFITLIGLGNAEIVEIRSGHFALTSHFAAPNVIVFGIGLLVAATLAHRKVSGAILWGIAAATVAALCFGKVKFGAVAALPENPMPILGKLDLGDVFANFLRLLPLILIFTMMDIFDTIGTLIGVATRAGMIDAKGNIPGLKQAFYSDAVATMSGALFGHSTVTSYIESSTGVESGGRTGLVAVVVGIGFLFALFFQPVISMIAAYPPITAPALVLVGVMMVSCVKEIDWEDLSEALPSFLVIVGIVFFYSIADGIVLALVFYPLLKLLCRKGKELGLVTYIIAALLLIYLIWR
ncbi:MAG: NCS2 family permease, partial [Victivallaceae bacterium]